MELVIDYKPHINQIKIHEAMESGKYNFISLTASRQFGKSKLMLMATIKLLFNDDRFNNAWIVSPTDAQSLRLYNILHDGLQKSHLIKTSTKRTADYTLKLINNKYIKLKSARSEDNLRGSNVDLLIVDEAAFISASIIYKVLMPMIITKKNALFMAISTPNGKNWFYDFHRKCQDQDDEKSISFLYTYKDNPMVNMEIINQFKNTLPDHIFQQEFLCSFNDSASVFSNINECCITYKDVREFKQVFVGIDIGMKNDYTVVSIITDQGQFIDMLRITRLDVDEMIDKINSFLERYNIKKILIEENNQGIVFYQILKKKWRDKIIPFNTNQKTKPKIITDLITDFSNKVFSFLENELFIGELNDFIYKIDATSGKIKYQSASGHDDIVMSVAIGWHLYKKYGSINTSKPPIVII